MKKSGNGGRTRNEGEGPRKVETKKTLSVEIGKLAPGDDCDNVTRKRKRTGAPRKGEGNERRFVGGNEINFH